MQDPFAAPAPDDDGLPPPRRLSPGCLAALVISSIGLVIVGILICQVLGSVLTDIAPPRP